MELRTSARFKTYVINLERSTDRREGITRNLTEHGIEHEIFPAVDGRAVDVLEDERYDRATRIAKFGYDLTVGEIGCYLSHLKCIEKAYGEGLDKVCVLEDDIRVTDDFKDILECCMALPAGYDMIKLFGLRRRKTLNILRIDEAHRLVVPLHATGGTQAYILDRNGMRTVLETCGAITMQLDSKLDRYWESGLRIFAVEPYPVRADLATPSDIAAPAVDAWRADGNRRLRRRLKVRKLQDSLTRRIVNVRLRLKRALGAFPGSTRVEGP